MIGPETKKKKQVWDRFSIWVPDAVRIKWDYVWKVPWKLKDIKQIDYLFKWDKISESIFKQ